MDLNVLSEALTMATVVVYVLLPLAYWALARRWYGSKTGRAVMWLLTALAVSLVYILFGVFFGDHAGRAAFRIATLIYILAAGSRFMLLLFETQIGSIYRRGQKETV